tara:strand:+ start:280 stop:507 length:228 start_codon:yes stop_codon:yes gene_type:complete
VKKKKKETDREAVARLFKTRTGVQYENWLQAWVVSEMKKGLPDVEPGDTYSIVKNYGHDKKAEVLATIEAIKTQE